MADSSEELIDLTEANDPELFHYASLLDERFGAKANWKLSSSRPTAYSDKLDAIIMNRSYSESLASSAGMNSASLKFALFYLCAHERVHAWQRIRDEKRGLDAFSAYEQHQRRYELEADFIAGYLHMQHIVFAIGEKSLAQTGDDSDVMVAAYTGVHLGTSEDLRKLTEHIGNPETHGTSEERTLEFQWGMALCARSFRDRKPDDEAWANCLSEAEQTAGSISVV